MGQDVKALAGTVVVEVKAACEELARVKGWNMSGVQGLVKCAPLIIKHVEKVGVTASLSGEEKKALAIELLLRVVKLPWWLPEGMVREGLGYLIDMVVSALKDKFGA